MEPFTEDRKGREATPRGGPSRKKPLHCYIWGFTKEFAKTTATEVLHVAVELLHQGWVRGDLRDDGR